MKKTRLSLVDIDTNGIDLNVVWEGSINEIEIPDLFNKIDSAVVSKGLRNQTVVIRI